MLPDIRVSGKKNIAIEKAPLTPDPLSGHAPVAFRDGQRTRVGFAQKFKYEFKSPPRLSWDQRGRRVGCGVRS